MSDRPLATLKRFGFVPGWLGLARIAVWVLIGVIAIDVLIPESAPALETDFYNRTASTEWVRSIATPRGDPRGFVPTSDHGVFKIAWVAGSETLESPKPGQYRFLATAVRDRVSSVGDLPVSIDVYFVSGMRIVDEYAAVQAAIDDGVDAIVASLNPVWSTTDLAIQGSDSLDSELAAHLLDQPSGWYVGASLLAPSDLFWGEASRVSNAVKDRYHWGAAMQARVDEWTVLPDAAPGARTATTELDELDKIRAMSSPLEFWSTYDPVVGPEVAGSARAAVTFERYATSRSGFNRRLLRLLGETITESGIPTVVYDAQVNYTTLNDRLVAPYVARVEATLASQSKYFESAQVRFRPETLSRRADDMLFKDIVHVQSFGSAARLVAADLCAVLDASGHRPQCED